MNKKKQKQKNKNKSVPRCKAKKKAKHKIQNEVSTNVTKNIKDTAHWFKNEILSRGSQIGVFWDPGLGLFDGRGQGIFNKKWTWREMRNCWY